MASTALDRSSNATRRRLDYSVLVLVFLPLAIFAVTMVLPLIAVVVTVIQGSGVGSIVSPLAEPVFRSALARTLVLSAVVTGLTWIVGLVYALGAVVSAPRARSILLGILFVSFWVSLLVRTYGWVVLFQPRGALYKFLNFFGLREAPLDLIQTTGAMYPAMVHVMLPYMVLPLLAALYQVDSTQIAAAQSMGAPVNLILRRVLMPQMASGTAAGAILVFILSLGFFVTPAFLGGPRNMMLSTLVEMKFRAVFDFGAAAIIGVSLLVIVLVLLIIADRLFGVTRVWRSSM